MGVSVSSQQALSHWLRQWRCSTGWGLSSRGVKVRQSIKGCHSDDVGVYLIWVFLNHSGYLGSLKVQTARGANGQDQPVFAWVNFDSEAHAAQAKKDLGGKLLEFRSSNGHSAVYRLNVLIQRAVVDSVPREISAGLEEEAVPIAINTQPQTGK